MQGYISGIVKLKNEDLIIKVITQNKFLTLYRFYGMRHSIINIGRKIDFEIDYSGMFMPRLRSVMQLGFQWENDYGKMHYFQTFLKLLNTHLEGAESIPSFYYELLNEAIKKIEKQSASRTLLDLYAMLLEYEGRKSNRVCFNCGEALETHSLIIRGFLASHTKCTPSGFKISTNNFFTFLQNNKSIFLNDDEVNGLFEILLKGL